MSRFPRLAPVRLPLVPVVSLLLLVGATAPAAAHVEVSADEGAQAGTGPVTVVFAAESESNTAGIVGVKTQLPAGIPPADVALATAPTGWALTPNTDGFEVAGPAIEPGQDLEFGVTIARLPADTTELPFKTLQRYSDGHEDAWIEVPTDAVPEPEMPAPVLAVAPAPPASTPSSPAAETSPSTGASGAQAEPSTAADPAEGGLPAGTVAAIVAGIALVALVGAGAWWRRSRRG